MKTDESLQGRPRDLDTKRNAGMKYYVVYKKVYEDCS